MKNNEGKIIIAVYIEQEKGYLARDELNRKKKKKKRNLVNLKENSLGALF